MAQDKKTQSEKATKTQIISLSLHETLLKQLDSLQESYGFSGRSEAIRSGIRLLAKEQQELEKLSGTIHAVLLLIHHHDKTNKLFSQLHGHEHIVKTQLHHHIKDHRCLETFILEGDAKNIQQLIKGVRTSELAEVLRLVIL